jgi:phospholipase C
MPGPTWPNRFFAVAASSGGLDHSPSTDQIFLWESFSGFSFQNGTIFDALSRGNKTWRIYRGDKGDISGSLPIAAALKGVRIFDVARYSEFAVMWSTVRVPAELDYWADTSASDRLLPSGSRTSTWRTPLP